MEMKLSQENVFKLINLYRSRPLLWDMSSKSYRRNDLKNKAYELIAKEMGMMVEVVKKKIRNLRTTYTNEKRKINAKKSGSGAEEQYVSSLPWFTEMNFLDNSIVIRKTMDNSAEDVLTSEIMEESLESDFEEFFSNSPRKPLCDEFSKKKPPRNATAAATDKIDKVLEKLINESESEFTTFGTSIAQQLESMSKEPAYELMSEIQNLICQKKIKELRKNCFRPLTANPESSSSSNNISTPSSDILSLAVTDAEIEFETDYESSPI